MSPASCPSRSRVVEAICILLSEQHPGPSRTEKQYISRWRLILRDYNAIRQRLMNSEALLEGTGLVLFHINETTLVRKCVFEPHAIKWLTSR